MIRRFTYLIISFLLLGCQYVFAQATLREAQRQAELLNFNDAINLYEKAFDKRETLMAARGLADSYRQLHNYPFAESWYAKVVQMEGHEPMDLFYYAEALQNNSKYHESKQWYLKYKEEAGEEVLSNLEQLISACDSAGYRMQHPVNFVFKLDTSLNTLQSDWGAFPYKNGIVFTSDRIINQKASKKPILFFDANNTLKKDVSGWTGLPYLKLFYSERKGEKWDEPQVFSNTLNGSFHNGPASFSKDGKEVYFTRTREIKNSKAYTHDKRKQKDYTIRLEVYSSKLDEQTSNWSEPQPFAYNAPLDYSVSDACLSADSKYLYFASDMPGGEGMSDLYYCKRQSDGSWGKPVNLKGLNTAGTERFPSFDNENNLYFASTGFGGMGGLDIYRAGYLDENKWAKAQNIGYPVNTPQDDFNIVFAADGKSGYLSSNRDGGKGMDDIYQFTKKELMFKLEGTVVNKKTGVPLNNAIVTLYNKKTNTNIKAPTDAKGAFAFNLEENSEYTVTAEKTNFITSRKDSLSTIGYTESKTLHAKLSLGIDSIELYKGIRLDNIYYDFNKWNIRADAGPELDKLVQVMTDNPTMIIELSSHTDSRGADSYNLQLSQKRAEAAVNYIISKGIDTKRITAKGYGETKPVNNCGNGTNCSETEFQLNRRTEFAILRY
ncbi:flagellar motor protein MotB [Solitalea longa]|uniref:Flagellar motor protein MotB n=1 Tax=Solitalea longa TaxID=2079460 RepID=A0A2S4ZY96_9SPHI|nr:OmpA family protein [Solitalea longa]POY35324.1 flagellar motor protein MotB [Solitalea longa]